MLYAFLKRTVSPLFLGCFGHSPTYTLSYQPLVWHLDCVTYVVFLVADLLALECPTAGPSLPESSISCCNNTETTKEWVLRRLQLLRKQHCGVDEHISLPTSIKKGKVSSQNKHRLHHSSLKCLKNCILFCMWLSVFCEACQERSGLYGRVSGMLPVRVASYMLMPYTLPVQSAYSVAQR